MMSLLNCSSAVVRSSGANALPMLTPAQRDYIIHYAERMIEELELKL